MRTLELQNKNFVCEICEENNTNPIMAGVELDGDRMWPVRLCRGCGPIDLALMQFCREITIGCKDN